MRGRRNAGSLPDPIEQFREAIGGENQLEMDGGIANDKMESLATLYKLMSAEQLRRIVKMKLDGYEIIAVTQGTAG